MSDKKRIQFDFTPEALTSLDDLTDNLGATSRAETVRRALKLLDLVVKAKGTGSEVILRSGDRETLIVLV